MEKPSLIDEEQARSPFESLQLASQHDDDDVSIGSLSTRRDVDDPSPKKNTRDEKLVRAARGVVMLVLFVSAILVATFAYMSTSQNEFNVFQARFNSSAKQIIEMSTKNAANALTSMGGLAELFPFYAQQSNETLPFVTLPDFEALGKKVRDITMTSSIHFSPILNAEADIETWNAYAPNHLFWLENGREYTHEATNAFTGTTGNVTANASNVMPFVFDLDMTGAERRPIPARGPDLVAPLWQMTPAPPVFARFVNFNTASRPMVQEALVSIMETGLPSLSKAISSKDYYGIPIEGSLSLLLYPVFDGFSYEPNRKVVGSLSSLLAWTNFFDNILSEGQNGIDVVVQSCDAFNTFRINGPTAVFSGEGDLHDRSYNYMGVSQAFIEMGNDERVGQCRHSVTIFPTRELEEIERTGNPWRFAVATFVIFVFAAMVFLLYDWFVSNRQNRTEMRADKSSAIVQQLFPGDVANKLFDGTTDPSKRNTAFTKPDKAPMERTTIAEMYSETTVLFADIAGFTAWSSTRDPNQVLTLLESIFQAFDGIAKKLGVFKVETIGDCYVAVCGVPKANKEHAMIMSSFARSALLKFRSVCRNLELTLGPDTGDLALRVGMHSGPVTAGVLRGDRARFQLFGDTVNTASRIESTGQRDRIHLSEQTALELTKCGKQEWLIPREDAVEAKGKGTLTTYWLKITSGNSTPTEAMESNERVDMLTSMGSNDALTLSTYHGDSSNRKHHRLVHWNCVLLTQLLQRVVATRKENTRAQSATDLTAMACRIAKRSMTADEVVESVEFPEVMYNIPTEVVADLTAEIEEQLRAFVSKIASMYNENAFHNFEHASHVTMSVSKLLGRVSTEHDTEGAPRQTVAIATDPLTQFAVVLSALIHDLDHAGVANSQLVQEDRKLAERYNNKSVAEQNSVDLAWNTLLLPEFGQLRMAIFPTELDLRRFRQILVNSVMATDIFDKERSTLRTSRWNAAFHDTTSVNDDSDSDLARQKATLILEHLIQASDVAHTMQHWHIYQKWNQRLFDEMMTAYRAGRSSTDPSLGWYTGELWFYDNYVIPLAQKLKECGAFGVASDEYLNYAVQNRDEWESKGAKVVEQYLKEFGAKAPTGKEKVREQVEL